MQASLIRGGAADLVDALCIAAAGPISNRAPERESIGRLLAGLAVVNLHGNLIERIPAQGALPPLPLLRELNLSSNGVEDLDCSALAAAAPDLEVLDVAANGISVVRGVLDLTALRVLRMPYNALRTLEFLVERAAPKPASPRPDPGAPLAAEESDAAPFRLLRHLHEADLRDNEIRTVDQIAYLAAAPALRTLSLSNADGTAANPVCSVPGYTGAVARACPNLTSLDGQPIVVARAE